MALQPFNVVKNIALGFGLETQSRLAALPLAVKAWNQTASQFNSYRRVQKSVAWPGVYPLGFGGGNQDLLVSKAGAAAAYCLVPEVHNCVSSIVGAVESLPWDIRRYPNGLRRENGRSVQGDIIASDDDLQTRHPLQRALRRFQQNNNFSLIGTMVFDYELYGEVALEIAANVFGQNSIIEWLNPLGVQVFATHDIQAIRYGWNTTFISYAPDEVAYLHNRNPQDDFTGYPKVLAAMDKINIVRNLDRFLRDYFINNARPSLVVMPPAEERFSATDFANIKNQFRESLKGAGGQFNTWVTQMPVQTLALEQPDLMKNGQLSESEVQAIYEKFSVPRALRGNTQQSPYKSGSEVIERFYKDAVYPLAKIIQRFINTELMPYFDQTSGLEVFEFDTSAYDHVTESDQLEEQIVTSQVNAGYVSLAEAQRIQERAVDPFLEHRYMIRGLPMTAAQIEALVEAEIATAQAAMQPQALFSVPQTNPILPSNTPPRLLPEPAKAGVKAVSTDKSQSYAVLGYFDDVKPIQHFADALRGILHPDTKWVNSDEWHVTLLQSDDAHFAAIQESLPTNPGAFSVTIDGMDWFDTNDGYALHLTLRQEGALPAVQSALAQTALENGITISPFSVPSHYKPHITLCYGVGSTDAFDITPFSLLINRIEVSNAAHETIIQHNLKIADHYIGGIDWANGSDVTVEHHHDPDGLHSWQVKLYADDPDEPAIQAALQAELKTWRAFELARVGKAHRDFKTDVLPPYMAYALYDTLDTCETKTDVDSAFAGILEHPRVKSLAAYQSSLRELGTGFWRGDIEHGDFIFRAGNAISREFENAFYDGVARGGLERAELTADELGELVAVINSERDYLRGLADWIDQNTRARGGKLIAVRGRLDNWIGRYRQVEELGYLIGAREKRLRWKRNKRSDSCVDCIRLDGRVYPARRWKAAHLRPGYAGLNCSGFCTCGFEETTDPITRGRIPGLVGRKAVDILESFDPSQARDDSGQWTGGGSSGGAGGEDKPPKPSVDISAKDTKVSKKVFGKDFEPDDLPDVVGINNVPGVDKVEVSSKGDIVTVKTGSPDDTSKPFLQREFYATKKYDKEKGKWVQEKHCYNADFFLPKEQQGKGLGTKVFHDQVSNLREKGFTSIKTLAGKGDNMNGYYTWARLGYDGDLPVDLPKRPPSLKSAARVSDLMKTSEGRDWWKKNGVEMEMEFSLDASSTSSRVLDEYMKQKAA